MQAVDTRQMDDFGSLLDTLLDEMPEARRALHEGIADATKLEVDAAIAGASLNDWNGTVRRWQMAHVGSGGGYAAVRPIGSSEGATTGPNSPGAITNYLTGGHKIRGTRGGKDYRPRIRVAYVNGYHFYQKARQGAEATAIKMAEQYVSSFADKLEGR